MPLLSIQNLQVKYRVNNKEIHAVHNVSFDVEQQDSVGIVGESGSGKSTLAMALLRLLPERIAEVSGEVLFAGENLLTLDDARLKARRWTEMAVVFQKSMSALSPVHKIGYQMADIYKVHVKAATKEQAKARILELLEMVNLPARVYTMYPHELSGGMMQRVSIALSLMHNPKLLILDEATTALDVVTQGQILKEIMQLEERLNIARIMITHDMSVVATTCKKVAVMYAGNLLEFGLVKDIIAAPEHPYTKGLLQSIPALKGERGELKGIAGSLPDLSKSPSGCIFADRCPSRKPTCETETPIRRTLADGRMVACHIAGS
ncbi:ABC transporter ATP-binding protein [Brevibacillus centrosporus]|uniref:ABC transporter ATP-binding protein n=1 Tax=Brevibacillus centrosporus TaxID=54910 RepID=UPI003B0211A2